MINKHILDFCNKKGFKECEILNAYKIFFGTLVSEPRLKIINHLRKKKMNVTELTKVLKLDQTVISHNIARLKKCGFIKQEIQGKYRYYSLNNKTIKPLMGIIDKHMSDHCIHILRKTKGMKNNE